MRNVYLFLLSLIIPFVSSSQEIWDLERCINYAIENSLSVQQSDLLIRDAEIVTKLSEQQILPTVSGSTSAFSNFGRTIDPTSNEFVTANFLSNNFSINAGISIYNGGLLKNRINQNRAEEDAAEADKTSMTTTVTLNVIFAYFEALFARDNYANAEIDLKTINDQIVQMKKLVEAGSRAQFEIYDLEAQQASSEQLLTAAQNRIDLAMLSLKGVMNIDPNTEMVLAEPPVEQATYTDLDNTTFEEIYRNVASTRPEIQAFDYRIKSSEIGVEIAKSAFYPSITFGASLSSNYSNQAKTAENFVTELVNSPVFINGENATLGVEQTFPTSFPNVPYLTQLDDNFSYGMGLQVSIPILNNYTAKGNTERAKLNLELQRTNKEQYIIDLRNILGQYLTDAKAAQRNLEAADKLLAARQVAYENAEKRFNLGAINSFDYISIQDQLNTARTQQLIAKYDYMMRIKIVDFYQGFPVTLK